MMITISTSGGIGGFGLKKSAEIAVESLPKSLQAEACARLDAKTLGALDTTPVRGAADRIVYHIVVTEEGEPATRFDLPESSLPDETLDLIDTLLDKGSGG